MTDNDFINCGLSELFRLDRMLLRRSQEIIQKSDIQLKDLNKLNESAVGNVEFAIKIECPGVGVGTILRDLTIVNISGKFR